LEIGLPKLREINNRPISNRPQDAILDAILPHKSRFKDLVAQTIGFALCPDWQAAKTMSCHGNALD